MKKIIGQFFFTSLVVFSSQVHADAKDELKQQLNQVKTLHSKFTQNVVDVNNKNIQQGSGIFSLAYPNQLYWHLTEPDESLIIANEKSVWLYNPFAEEVTILDLEQAVSTSPMTLLIHRDEATWSNYRVTKTEVTKGSPKDDSCYSITPKFSDSTVVKVDACFNHNRLNKFAIFDSQGNISTFDLTEQRNLNEEERSIFNFVIPDNVDVDDQRAKKIQ
ncbi:outer membrane lipoprotein carrier protein LolA [Parashewanella spongiae]|uniref:Outer-membrane lipoprotein carrier protein n=1 Tax=Parashewanella spongiae TaxID=342950 RepID=A0A3A6UL39_9GAMM|nr:outer membrane lipoprotein chaperone LolA [Parashewanella spongiae]MCL1077364.1 outer membrane lipoprotein chaperone LolA [Parashewanella spongiae]RJY18331.1 outer membrane lipoprotein carrier protein LolA [Parashewanella spongiae]